MIFVRYDVDNVLVNDISIDSNIKGSIFLKNRHFFLCKKGLIIN